MENPAYKSFEELYPMPMSSIEKFHWFDDNPEYPNFVFCRIRIEGKLDRQIARDAWQITIQRQPIGDVEPKNLHGRWSWVQGPRSKGISDFEKWNGTRFEWMEFESRPEPWKMKEHTVASPTGSYLGVSSWPVTTRDPNSSSEGSCHVTEIWFYVHHAIGDGSGSIMCINEWMKIYTNLLNDDPPEKNLHQLDPKLMYRRNHLGLTSWRYLKHLWKQPIALFGATKFVFRKTSNLTKGGYSTATAKEVFPSIIGVWLEHEDTQLLENQAKQFNVMTNTIMLGKLFLALADWRTKQSCHKDSDWIRIILPMSIRNVSDRRMPTANRATIVQIDRRSKDGMDLQDFYNGIDHEIKVIRGWQLDKMFLIVIRLLSCFDWLLKRSARSEKSRGMALFTNLGAPLRSSEKAARNEPDPSKLITPTEFDFVGPIRKGTPVNFTASKYGKRIRLSLHLDNRILSGEQAEQLLRTFKLHLQQ